MRMLTLQHLVALLEQSGGVQLGIPVALCLSKIDCLSEEARDAARADAAAALRARLGETTFTWFEAVCPTLRCFALSSAGSVDGRVQPEGLDEVFDWLADVSRLPAVRRIVLDGLTRDAVATLVAAVVGGAKEVVETLEDNANGKNAVAGEMGKAARDGKFEFVVSQMDCS